MRIYAKKFKILSLFIIICFLFNTTVAPYAYASHLGAWDDHIGIPGPDVPPPYNPDNPDNPDAPPCNPSPPPPPDMCPNPESPPDPGDEDKSECTGGEPVSLYDGSFYYRHTDLEIPGRMSLSLKRAYDTRSTYNGVFGYGWSFNFHTRLFKVSDGTLLLKRGDNTEDTFTYDNVTGNHLSPLGKYETIISNSDGTYVLKSKYGSKYHFDINGVLVKMENTKGNQIFLSYDPAGKLPISGISPYSNITNSIVIGYDYRLIKIEEAQNDIPSGRFIEFFYNNDGRIIKAKDFTDREVIYTYDPSGNGDLLSVQDPEGNLYEYVYDEHRIAVFSDTASCSGCGGLGGGVHINTYDDQKRISRQVHGNNIVDIEYIVPYEKTKVTTSIYNDETEEFLHTRYEYFEFDEDGYTIKQTRQMGDFLDEDGGTENDDIIKEMVYNNAKKVESKTYAQGNAVDYTYDDKGNILTKTVTLEDGTIVTTRYTYEPNNSKAMSKEITSTDTSQTYRKEYTRYADGSIHEEKTILDDTTTYTTTYTYTAQGDIDTIIDPRGNTIKHEYNGYGYLTRVYDPNNPSHQTLYGYNDVGNRVSMTDANNNTSTFTYDKLNRITKITTPKNEETIYTWEGTNLIQIETGKLGAQEGRITQIEYDDLNRKTAIKQKNDSAVFVTMAAYTYDSEGKVLTTTDALGHTTANSYDVMGRLIQVTSPLSQATSYEYDKNSNLIAVIDANNNTTEYEYDKTSRLSKVIQYEGTAPIETSYIYDFQGNIKTITDAETHTTTNIYDNLGRLIQVTSPMSQVTSYEYDANGNLTKKTDAKNQVIEYEYNAYNQLTHVYYGGKTSPIKTVAFTYDDVGNMETWSDGAYSATYIYDELNRVLNVATQYPLGTKTVSYTYDRFGNKATLIYPDALGAVTYSYDAFNRLVQVTGPMSQVTGYEYDNSGRLLSKTLPNGVYTDYGYDDANRLTSLVNKKSDASVISSFSYTHDGVGNRVQTIDHRPSTMDYTYDDVYRLKQVDEDTVTTETYSYDNVGNRETSVAHSDWMYDSENKLQSYNGITYNYDNNGNLISKDDNGSLTTYSWDYENRLTGVINASNISYSYDPFGKRISKTVDGVTKYYLYDSEDIIVEYDAGGVVVAHYVHGQGIDEPISMTRNSNTYYYTMDGLGSVRGLTDNIEAVVESYEYDSFGNLKSQPATGNPYTYTSREYDAETELYFYRARYYDSSVGRFISADIIGFFGGINFYTYVENNPILRLDVFGLAWTTIDFIYHFYRGGGTTVDISTVGLLERYKMDSSVGVVRSFSEMEVKIKTRSFYQTLNGGESGDFKVSGAGLVYVTTIYVLAGGYLNYNGNCVAVKDKNCECVTTVCEMSYNFRDTFTDPLDTGKDYGGTKYDIIGSWKDTYSYKYCPRGEK
ncbi:MAG: RHS repeat-associated core domain-containing protein [Candidatus Omnitrophota bacterium]